MNRSLFRTIGIFGCFVSIIITSVICSRNLMLARAGCSTDAKFFVGAQKSADSSSDPCAVVRQRKKKLNAPEAIRLAECFIAENGYTDVDPTLGRRHLARESVDPGTDELGMRMRRDSLESKAYGYVRGPRPSDGWTVLFRKKYKAEEVKLIPNYEERIRKTGRAVRTDAYGREIKIEHQDFYLDFPSLKKLSP